MNATLYFVLEHFNESCNCTIPSGWKARLNDYKLAKHEHPIPDQFYGETREEAEANVRAAFPQIKKVTFIS